MDGNPVIFIPLSDIEPFKCQRPKDVARYVAMLAAGKEPPMIWVWKCKPPCRYTYRICDGVHRVEAARRAGRSHIMARICFGLHSFVWTRNGLRAQVE
jgi:hypothetical protein